MGEREGDSGEGKGALETSEFTPKALKTLHDALALTDEARVITSMGKPFKIMHTNTAWSRITGFKFTEAVGKTCALLHGPKTEADVLDLLEESLARKVSTTVHLTNYTATGNPFKNTLTIHPLCNSQGDVVNYAATVYAKPITDGSVEPVAPEIHAAKLSTAHAWGALRLLGVNLAEGAAAVHGHEAREEAANSLLGNYEKVLLDVTSSSVTDNIEGRHVSAEHSSHVEQFLREVTRRLLGRLPDTSTNLELLDLEYFVDPSTPHQAAAWVGAAAYLNGRFQSQAGQSPGRDADMSPAAAAAMKAVMAEVSADAAAWDSLRLLLERGGRAQPQEGEAAAHSPAAHVEAAHKLISNHAQVLRDLTNVFPGRNIHGQLLTQQHLKRLPAQDRRRVDRFLQALSSRLLGERDIPQPQGNDEADRAHEAEVWAAAAKYLEGRLQSSADQKPGRTPDMSQSAAAAMRGVMSELVGGIGANPFDMPPAFTSGSTWDTLNKTYAAAQPKNSPKRLKRSVGRGRDLHSSFSNEKDAIIFTEARAPYKITHCNKAWCDMCGYSLDEIEGATNAILQGPDTDLSVIADLMSCVRRSEPACVTVVNYKKGGIPFVNQLQVDPVYDDNDEITHFMAILNETDTTPLPVACA
eukprot:CAMPEP_0119300274 /NCGR_PEP_ID=MMETSP1333-20130426/2234_1 /TAXON_ID=418940 /ORGANISM="Scyphosphaera apsteinii, Strain RCC1455" /LENGTH=638 /DNA_ID=CAMNT_0007301985 /DNA_START=25 /DNA_END=1941 /DNA_ORIENTATION=-